MCIGVPMQIVSVDGVAARATSETGEHLIDLSLLDGVKPGDWVLTFLDVAREIIDAQDAMKISAALAAVSAAMSGGDIGDAFADIEARGPELPPHLQAAVERGDCVG